MTCGDFKSHKSFLPDEQYGICLDNIVKAREPNSFIRAGQSTVSELMGSLIAVTGTGLH